MNLSFDNAPQRKSELPVLTQQEFNAFWKTRRRAIHPKMFALIIPLEFFLGTVVGLIATAVNQTEGFLILLMVILYMTFFLHLPYVLVSMILWKVFLTKNFPKGTTIEEAIELRQASRRIIKEGMPHIEETASPFSQIGTQYSLYKQPDDSLPPSQSNPEPTIESQSEPVVSRRQRREQQQKPSTIDSMKSKLPSFSDLGVSYRQGSIQNYGVPHPSRNEEIARLNQIDPFKYR